MCMTMKSEDWGNMIFDPGAVVGKGLTKASGGKGAMGALGKVTSTFTTEGLASKLNPDPITTESPYQPLQQTEELSSRRKSKLMK